jgi:hypothetical protein
MTRIALLVGIFIVTVLVGGAYAVALWLHRLFWPSNEPTEETDD